MSQAGEGFGWPCDAHGVDFVILCRFPGAGFNRCHHCGRPGSGDGALKAQVRFCSPECVSAFNAEHPREAALWVPIEEALPGGPYDGVFENSGLALESKPPT